MSLFRLSILSILLVQSAFAAAPNPSRYPYEAKLNAGPMQTSQVIKTTIPTEVLGQLREDFGNLQLVDDLNADVAFTLYDEPAAVVNTINSLEVSSAHVDTDPANLLDNNRLTVFAFDQKIDSENPATITIDFGKIVELHRVEIWPTLMADVKGMEFRYALRRDDFKTLRRQGAFQPITDSTFPPLRWLEISLWGTDVVLEDIRLYQKEQAEIYFTAEPGRRYRILFGDKNLDNKRYAERVSETQRADQTFALAPMLFNPLAPDDFDGDGVINAEDNCPVMSNASQQDEDGDRIGDPCDNAVEVKNYDQSDVDGDLVGDIIDNCKLEANPDQKDKDKDGFGDVCDNAYAQESIFTRLGNSSNDTNLGMPISYAWLGGVLALLAVLGIGIAAGKKKR